MAFRGWPIEAIEFYEGLRADNSKTYWTAHKETYDSHVHAPMVALLADLEAEFGGAKIFRPYRDVRFSKDKTPYKTTIAATLDRGGYVQFSADGLGVGSGMYMLDSEQLTRFRDAVVDDGSGTDIEAIIGKLRQAGNDVTAHDVLKTVPRGYDKEHSRADLLRHKGLIVWRQWGVEPWLGTAKAKTKVVEFLRASQPLNDWLAKHVA